MAEAAQTFFKISWETNTNFSIRAIRLRHTHDPADTKNTTLKFFYDLGDGVKMPVIPNGQFTWAVRTAVFSVFAELIMVSVPLPCLLRPVARVSPAAPDSSTTGSRSPS